MKTMVQTHNDTNGNSTSSSSSSSSQSKQLTAYEILSLGVLVLETIVGILVNGFMMIINFFELVSCKKIGSCDLILACLAMARFSFMVLILTLYFISYFSSDVADSQSTTNNLQYTWLFFNYISLWFAAWLCIFYCVRIVNMQLYLFVIFKTHFDRWIPFFLLASVAISVSFSNSSAYTSLNSFVNMSKFEKSSKTSSFVLGGSDFATFSTLSVIGSIPPFFLFCAAAALVIGSIMKHTRKMKDHERKGFKETSLDAHCRAIKTMLTFFTFFLVYMVAFNLYASGSLENGISNCFCTVIIGAYPSIHSVFLVFGNRKLKNILIKMLQKVNLYRPELTQTEIIST